MPEPGTYRVVNATTNLALGSTKRPPADWAPMEAVPRDDGLKVKVSYDDGRCIMQLESGHFVFTRGQYDGDDIISSPHPGYWGFKWGMRPMHYKIITLGEPYYWTLEPGTKPGSPVKVRMNQPGEPGQEWFFEPV